MSLRIKERFIEHVNREQLSVEDIIRQLNISDVTVYSVMDITRDNSVEVIEMVSEYLRSCEKDKTTKDDKDIPVLPKGVMNEEF